MESHLYGIIKKQLTLTTSFLGALGIMADVQLAKLLLDDLNI